ncbi:GNAT family N-acetyltransferase [Heyndrickxia oleronia]|uniref:GNAT family N-acetyltransferase n=1 Tax=Heyndrickxia oleronia TaxID=38875 RepID=A0AAW6SZ28_9BACI|nr:GNAT family N-acetyltransferase [Heyndrickxia oleronia]MDH5162563.1 GNAT family N-acetyltransferase [Heyndrickxia oleronia]
MVRVLKIDKNENLLETIDILYKQVWNHSIKERLIKHSNYKGFRGYVINSDEGDIIGFSYGYTSSPGQYYHDLISNELSQIEYDKWLVDCFEFVELAVHPLYRNKGYGKLLINELLRGVKNRTVVLTTQSNNQSAHNLYQGLGWSVINESFIPENNDNTYSIMGKVLI